MKKFKYKRRTADDVAKHQQSQRGDFDSLFTNVVKTFVPAEGANNIRIMPPTSEDMDHYGISVAVHYNVGHKGMYWCLKKMGKGPCPVCKVWNAATAEAVTETEKEDAKALRPTSRTLVYLIDRANEDDGPLVWSMPYTVDSEISGLMLDDELEGGVVPIDDPDDGFDIQFKKVVEKGRRFPDYVNYKIARKSSPLAKDTRDQDDWLEHVMKYPLDSILNFYDYDHIENVLNGEVEKKEEEEEEVPRGGRGSRRAQDEEATEEETPAEDEKAPEEEETPRARTRVSRGEEDDKPKRTSSTSQFRRTSANRR